MSSDIDLGEIRRVLRHELVAIRGQWAWLLALGIVLVVVGTIAIGMPLLTTLATVLTIGVLLLLGGVAQLVGAFWTRDWSGFFLMLLMGVLYIVLGLLFVRQPIEAAEALTLLLACTLMVSGVFRIAGSLMHRFPQWGWIFFGGVLNLALGVMIWLHGRSLASGSSACSWESTCSSVAGHGLCWPYDSKACPGPARPPWPDGSPWESGSPVESTWPNTSLQ